LDEAGNKGSGTLIFPAIQKKTRRWQQEQGDAKEQEEKQTSEV